MIVVFGSIIVDHLFAVPALPRAGETVLGDRYRVLPGGKGANQAIAAARDGASVRLVGAVGRDHLGAMALSGVVAAGVDVAGVREVDLPTGAAAVGVASDGGNQIMVAAGANLAVEAPWLDGVLGAGDTLVLQRELPQRETELAIERARAAGASIILNLAPALALAEDALRAVDLLVVNEIEAASLATRLGATTPDAPSLAQRLGVPAIVTLGEEGAQGCAAGRVWRTPALLVDAVDTTGAGDAFVGVLAAALGRGEALETAVRRACVAGSLSCRAPGAQGALPDRSAIDAALRLQATELAET